MQLENLERICAPERKIYIISYLIGSPDFFTGHIANRKRKDDSLLLDIAPWIGFRSTENQVMNDPNTQDIYRGLRLYSTDDVTIAHTAHTTEASRVVERRLGEITDEFLEYLAMAKAL